MSTIGPSGSGISRTAIVGDVHGMAAEFAILLERLALSPGDRLVSVGDLINKGPDSPGVFRLLHEQVERGVRVDFVLGNHEWKMRRHLRDTLEAPEKVRALIESLRPEDRKWIARAPLHLELPEHEALVVHAGVLPGWTDLPPADPVDAAVSDPQRADELVRLRHVTEKGGTFVSLGKDAPDDPNWCSIYDGRFGRIYFGHQPFLDAAGPARFPHATALDLGCVYGGALAAVVLVDGVEVEDVVVRPERAYAGWKHRRTPRTDAGS